VFFWSEPKTPWWKVALHREPRSQQVVANTYDNCRDMSGFMSSLEAPLKFLDLKSSRALISAIKLNRKESLLATQALCGKLGISDVP
jgi:hypothetical protein